VEKGIKRSVLYSLIDHSLPLDPDEEKTYRRIIQENPMFQEAKMLQSIEEVGIEKGIEQGIEKGIEKGIEQGVEQEKEATAKKLLLSQWLTKEQISEITGLDREKLEKLENKLKFE
jgi:predicted transposase/invertase (TIGR01784 family)